MKKVLDLYELAWAAGLFDGEGHTSFYANLENPNMYASRRIGIAICQRTENIYVLQRFQKAVCGLGIIRNRKIYGKNTKPQSTYEVGKFEHVQAIIAMMWRRLSPEKKTQAKHALTSFIKYNPYIINSKHGLLGRHEKVNKKLRDRKWSTDIGDIVDI